MGGRSSRKAAEKARAFVKTLREENSEEEEEEEVPDEDDEDWVSDGEVSV